MRGSEGEPFYGARWFHVEPSLKFPSTVFSPSKGANDNTPRRFYHKPFYIMAQITLDKGILQGFQQSLTDSFLKKRVLQIPMVLDRIFYKGFTWNPFSELYLEPNIKGYA